MREKDLGIWQSWTWGEVAVRVADLAGGLAALGFRRGDKLALIGDNRPELYWAMAAVQALGGIRSEEHTSELQSLMRNSYAVFCLKKKRSINIPTSLDVHNT